MKKLMAIIERNQDKKKSYYFMLMVDLISILVALCYCLQEDTMLPFQCLPTQNKNPKELCPSHQHSL